GKPFYFVQIATILAKRRTIRPINRKRQTSSEMFVFILKPSLKGFYAYFEKEIKSIYPFSPIFTTAL
ncbi:hypothetical protein, partial [Streptococcus suis]|uniref:hypothetical protein n=1 Tax=Streptococcus suis TaxID=1307 RepID=UPI0012904540